MGRMVGAMRRLVVLTAALAGTLIGACTDQPTGPQAGTLSVRLANPNDGLDGAILFAVRGPAAPAGTPTPATGDTLWGGPFTGTANAYVVTGNIRTGVVLTFSVPDVNVANQYTATITQVAASSDYALRSLTGYSLSISK